MWRRILVGVLVVAATSATACGALAASGGSARTHAAHAQVASTSGPCGLTTTAPKIKHVVVIFMENNSYNTIMGSPSTPYIHSLASSCGLATNYHNITHQTGDTWLSHWIPKLRSTAVYKKHDTVIFLGWDEGEGGSAITGEDCAANPSDVSCHVVMIVIGPSVKKGKKVSTRFDHYSLLKSSEILLGLPQLDQAAGAKSMVKAFNL